MPSAKAMGRKKQRRRGVRQPGQPGAAGGVTSGQVPSARMGADHLFGVAQSTRRDLIYVTSINMALSGTPPVYTQSNFRLNTPYQPQVGGGNATGFNKMMAFYSKCYTLGARIRVTYGVGLSDSELSGDFNVFVGLSINTENPTITLANAIARELTVFSNHTRGMASGRLQNSVDVARFLDKKWVVDDPALYCEETIAPVELIYGQVWAGHEYYVAGPTSIDAVVEIAFNCVFTDPKPFS